jgi:hypothetical protein
MLPEQLRTTGTKGITQCERSDQHIIELTRNWDEVGDEVDRRREVGDEEDKDFFMRLPSPGEIADSEQLAEAVALALRHAPLSDPKERATKEVQEWAEAGSIDRSSSDILAKRGVEVGHRIVAAGVVR